MASMGEAQTKRVTPSLPKGRYFFSGNEAVAEGADHVLAAVEGMRGAGPTVIVLDAAAPEDLRHIALAAAQMAPVPLLCGSGGLAVHVPEAFGWRPVRGRRMIDDDPDDGPVLVAVGGLLGWASSPMLSRVNHTVRLADRVWAEEQGLPLPPDSGQGFSLVSRQEADTLSDSLVAAVYKGREIRLLSPDPNSSFTIVPNIPQEFQRIEIAASCSMPLPNGLSLWVDGEKWHTWSGPPYRTFWPLSPGIHAFYVEAIDPSKHAASSSPIYITVHAAQNDRERISP